jgi:hypothetical protein
LAATVDVGTYGLADLGANGCQSLGKFGGSKAIAWKLLMVQPLQLFDLAGLQTLKVAVDSFYTFKPQFVKYIVVNNPAWQEDEVSNSPSVNGFYKLKS